MKLYGIVPFAKLEQAHSIPCKRLRPSCSHGICIVISIGYQSFLGLDELISIMFINLLLM
jgi:hypothetical protein